MFFDHGYYMGGMHAFWWLFWLILVVVLGYAVRSPPPRAGRPDRESPHELLQRRLANGDITPEAYEQTKALLDRDAGKLREHSSNVGRD
jgi:putative membrane protein